MKIAFGMIVFESDYVLRQCLEQVYPFAEQILIAEGPVSYWQKRGKATSEDDTNKIIDNFPDPYNKIKIVHGQFSEKDEQCKAYMSHIKDDIDYLWNLDSDEIYKSQDIQSIMSFLHKNEPTSVGIRSCSFYGGFEKYLTGFELKRDNFLRIFKYEKGATWLKHRPPTLKYQKSINKKHIDSETLFKETGVQMYHYSYVFPKQVYNKIAYYKSDVSKENCIDNYFYDVYMPWVCGDNMTKSQIEKKYMGVHEFKPHVRGECYTSNFNLIHPESIQNDIIFLQEKFKNQLKEYLKNG